MSNEEIVKILKDYSDFFSLNTIIETVLRGIGWAVVRVLAYLSDGISKILDKMFVMDMLYNNQNVIDFINSLKPLIGLLFAIGLIIVGYQLMFLQNKQFRKIAVNTLIAISVILLLPTAMTKMNGILNNGVAVTKGEPQDIVNQVIKANVVDLIKYDNDSFNHEKIKEYTSGNDISQDDIRYINVLETVDPDDVELKKEDVFEKKLTTDIKGNLAVKDLKQSWYNWKEYYFRYNINFVNLLISLLAISATMAFTCFKLGKLIFELAYNKALALLIAPVDISSGQKTKQIVQNVISIFVVTFLISLLFKFYVIFVQLCADINGIQGAILLIAGSFAVIDGPNLVERLFGIDAGLQSGFKTMMGAYATGRAFVGGAKATKSMIDNIPKIKGVSGEGNEKEKEKEKPKSIYEEIEGSNKPNSNNDSTPINSKPTKESSEKGEPKSVTKAPNSKNNNNNDFSGNKTNNNKNNDNKRTENNENTNINSGNGYGSSLSSNLNTSSREEKNRPQSIYEGMKKTPKNNNDKKGGK